MKPQAKQFFQFLEKRGEKPIPLEVKLLNPKEYKISPEDLDVKGNLELEYSQIRYLPNNLKVGGDLDLFKTPLKYLPDNLTVEGDIFLSFSQITYLPNNLKVGGNLDLRYTTLAKKYTKEQIRSMIEEKGGYVKKEIRI